MYGILFYLLLSYWTLVASETRLLFNEVGFGEQGFLEFLIEDDQNSRAFSSEGLNVILAKRVKDNRNMYIEAIISLKDMVPTLDKHLLISTRPYPKIPSSPKNTIIPGINARFGQHVTNQNLFYMDEEIVLILMLTYGGINIPELSMTTSFQRKIHFSEDVVEKIKDQLEDVLIFGGLRSVAPRKLVKYLYDNKFLATIQMPRRYSKQDTHSYSRCSDSLNAFLSDKFKDTLPTPGLENNCQTVLPDSALHLDPFIALTNVFEKIDTNCDIETVDDFVESIEETGMTIAQDIHVETSVSGDDTSMGLVEQTGGASVNEPTASGSGTVARFTPQFQDDCPITMDVEEDMGETVVEIAQSQAKRRRMADPLTSHMLDHTYSTMDWEHKYLKASDEVQMKTYQSNIFPLNEMRRFCWVEYVIDENDPKKSKVRCGMCYRFSGLASMRESDMHKIMKAGIMYPSMSQNLRALEDHDKSPIHMRVIQLKKFKALTDLKTNSLDFAIPSSGTSTSLNPESPYTITERIINTAYEMVRS